MTKYRIVSKNGSLFVEKRIFNLFWVVVFGKWVDLTHEDCELFIAHEIELLKTKQENKKKKFQVIKTFDI